MESPPGNCPLMKGEGPGAGRLYSFGGLAAAPQPKVSPALLFYPRRPSPQVAQSDRLPWAMA